MTEFSPEAPPESRALPWLLLLPLILLGWPWPSLIQGDFATTEHTALGLASLAILPLAIYLGWMRKSPSPGSLLLFLALFVPVNFGDASDKMEQERALLTFLCALFMLNGGALLASEGRRWLAITLSLISIVLVSPALLEGAPGWGGVLGNSGELSAAALPGALTGFVLWVHSKPRWQWVGMIATGLSLLHATFAPVIATLVVFAIVSGLTLVFSRRVDAVVRTKCFTLLACALGALAWTKWAPATSPATTSSAVASVDADAPTHFGGIEVRKRIWLSTAAMALDHPLVGVGPGQFAVEFPAYRDPEELALSTWNHKIEASTEVEHPHSDWILPWAEGGVLAGIAWWLFLLLVLRCAKQALGSRDVSTAALSAGALGGLFAAGVNAPLLYNPTASIAIFAVFGVVISSAPKLKVRRIHKSNKFGRYLVAVIALFHLLLLPRAYGLVNHGQALARLAASKTDTERGEAIEAAVACQEDSVVARTLEARLFEQRDGDLEAALASWERVLQLRPLRFEALMQRGVLLARTERLELAQASFDAATALDSTHPVLIRNRARLAAERGDSAAVFTELERLAELDAFDANWLLAVACKQVLQGRI
ncbi:MAG: O-antigen ligase, partial [Candidatus Paceibacteria bacterium]